LSAFDNGNKKNLECKEITNKLRKFEILKEVWKSSEGKGEIMDIHVYSANQVVSETYYQFILISMYSSCRKKNTCCLTKVSFITEDKMI